MPPKRVASVACLSVAILLTSCAGSGTGLLNPGARAPEVVGTTLDGTKLSLSDVRGNLAVVYFYPKNGTPGCTDEACAFRDAFAQYARRKVTIFGISQDSEGSHRRFQRNHVLPFPLVADESGAATRAYGVSTFLGMPSRVTFLVGSDGRILRSWTDVDPGVHAKEILSAVDIEQRKRSADPTGRPAGGRAVPAGSP